MGMKWILLGALGLSAVALVGIPYRRRVSAEAARLAEGLRLAEIERHKQAVYAGTEFVRPRDSGIEYDWDRVPGNYKDPDYQSPTTATAKNKSGISWI